MTKTFKKYFILGAAIVLAVALLSSCTNPSMERGLDQLNKSLAETQAAYDALEVESMLADLNEVTSTVTELQTKIAEHTAALEESNEGLLALQETIDSMTEETNRLISQVEAMQEQAADLSTKEQLQVLVLQAQELAEYTQLLLDFSDADGDGVYYKDDECPELAGPSSNDGCPVE